MEYIELAHGDASATICISNGSNLCRFQIDGIDFIDYREDVLRSGGYTGTPILYPTPNRVRNATFFFNKKKYVIEKQGRLLDCHGLVHDEEWQYTAPQKTADGMKLKTWIDFKEGNSIYEAFPFKHTLEIHFLLKERAIYIEYRLINNDNFPIPYGIGLHPFFLKLSGDLDTQIKINCKDYMERMPDFYPTKRVFNVEGTGYDLRNYIPVGDIEYNDVFCNITDPIETASIFYQSINKHIIMRASEDFKYVVLYNPKNEEFFCIEHQTCCTNAHNLYNEGFDSGIIVLQPGEIKSGFVEYRVY